MRRLSHVCSFSRDASSFQEGLRRRKLCVHLIAGGSGSCCICNVGSSNFCLGSISLPRGCHFNGVHFSKRNVDTSRRGRCLCSRIFGTLGTSSKCRSFGGGLTRRSVQIARRMGNGNTCKVSLCVRGIRGTRLFGNTSLSHGLACRGVRGLFSNITINLSSRVGEMKRFHRQISHRTFCVRNEKIATVPSLSVANDKGGSRRSSLVPSGGGQGHGDNPSFSL